MAGGRWRMLGANGSGDRARRRTSWVVSPRQRNRFVLRYFVEWRRVSPPSAAFGGVELPAFRGHAAGAR